MEQDSKDTSRQKFDKKICLIILDGFGHTEKTEHNAIHLAKPKCWEGFLSQYPHSLLETSGRSVGLPEGIMGNSEVGHLSIGSGRIIEQEFTRISNFSKTNGFETLPDVARVMSAQEGALHFMGLVSDGGVHSDIDHLFGLIDAAVRMKVRRQVNIHVITDGRDTPPNSGVGYIKKLEAKIENLPNIRIATVMGRFYAMDRDKRWERTERAYYYMTRSHTPCFTSGRGAIEDAYANGESDEFIVPRQVCKIGRIGPSDQVIFFNFRADRARQISEAFALPEFTEFETPIKIKPENWICFTQYQKSYPFPILFQKQTHTHLLGELVAQQGWKQLRVAETEKYAHVTYFFNGGEEKAYSNEDRILVQSPKEVATYDLKPEMSAFEVRDHVLSGMDKDYQMIVVNFANGDMVGHTGNEAAAIKAVETLDKCLCAIVDKGLKNGWNILISADHGNCEEMSNPETGEPFTQHTTNPVPFVWIANNLPKMNLRNGALADIAPTMLKMWGITQPKEMTGKPLF